MSVTKTISAITNDWEELRRGFFKLATINILSNLMVPLSGFINIAFLGHLTLKRHRLFFLIFSLRISVHL